MEKHESRSAICAKAHNCESKTMLVGCVMLACLHQVPGCWFGFFSALRGPTESCSYELLVSHRGYQGLA